MNTALFGKTSVTLEIPFGSSEIAQLVNDVLTVDKEIKGSGVIRDFHMKSDVLIINFESVDLKRLRVAVNAIFKNILLITKTVQNFPLK